MLNFKKYTTNLHFYSNVRYLKRVCDQHGSDIISKHLKKLKNLYNGDVVLPDKIFNIINLSSHKLTVSENSVLTKGLNFSIKKKVPPINRKIAMERLYFDIKCKKEKGYLSVEKLDDFRTELKHFGLKHCDDRSQPNLSKEEFEALKSISKNDSIIIKRPDKGG